LLKVSVDQQEVAVTSAGSRADGLSLTVAGRDVVLEPGGQVRQRLRQPGVTDWELDDRSRAPGP
jgi:hypothetical protein